MQRFELTSAHVQLLRHLNIEFREGPEWGGPGADCKRPFGNGDLVASMAGILLVPKVSTDDGPMLPPGTRAKMTKLYLELGTALQVVLTVGSFEPGVYFADDYDRNWHCQGASGAA
jgi:hypothetical protein